LYTGQLKMEMNFASGNSFANHNLCEKTTTMQILIAAWKINRCVICHQNATEKMIRS